MIDLTDQPVIIPIILLVARYRTLRVHSIYFTFRFILTSNCINRHDVVTIAPHQQQRKNLETYWARDQKHLAAKLLIIVQVSCNHHSYSHAECAYFKSRILRSSTPSGRNIEIFFFCIAKHVMTQWWEYSDSSSIKYTMEYSAYIWIKSAEGSKIVKGPWNPLRISFGMAVVI